MSPRPVTRAKLRGQDIENIDGREAVANMERAFWQARMTQQGEVPPPPALTDLPALAREIRATFPTGLERLQHAMLAPLTTRLLRLVYAPHTTPRLNLNRLELPR